MSPTAFASPYSTRYPLPPDEPVRYSCQDVYFDASAQSHTSAFTRS